MADFVAVLRKTVDALGDNTPEMREKVYDKARSTIEAKLAAINPPPPTAVADRQRRALEDAIAVVRAEFDTKTDESGEDDELEDVFASLGKSDAEPAVLAPASGAAGSAERKPLSPSSTPQQKNGETGAVAPASVSKAADPATDPLFAKSDDEADRIAAAPAVVKPARTRKARGGAGLLAALFALVVIAGAGYAVWLNRDDFAGMFQSAGPDDVATPEEEPAVTAGDLPEEAAEEGEAPDEPVEQTARTEPPAAGEPAEEQPAAAAPQAVPDPEPQKFTQRLLADGSEVDEGPAGGVPSVGEGTSVATAAAGDRSAQAGEASGTDGEETAAADETPAVAVGQRAIFYEEGTSSAQGSAETGSIVWSLVQESPGAELPPEPAIRAEATIPGKDVQLRMTIRRNGDQTLPASHIVEMIFLTPEGFEGGGINNVQRIAFKESEQAAGSPLLGIPARIADGFFLIALTDSPAEVEANMTLLRRQSWIDIPLVYQSGRRALITLEKGIPGDRVFQEAMQAWEQATSG